MYSGSNIFGFSKLLVLVSTANSQKPVHVAQQVSGMNNAFQRTKYLTQQPFYPAEVFGLDTPVLNTDSDVSITFEPLDSVN
jgi:hypothetical protein